MHIEVQHQRDVVYRLLDWLMRLPEGLEREYKSELRRFEESRAMPYVTSIERMGREEGRQEGRQIGRVESLRENIVDVLEARFGAVSRRVKARINAEGDGKRLKVLLRSAVTSGTLQEFKRITGLKDRRNTRTTGLETLR